MYIPNASKSCAMMGPINMGQYVGPMAQMGPPMNQMMMPNQVLTHVKPQKTLKPNKSYRNNATANMLLDCDERVQAALENQVSYTSYNNKWSILNCTRFIKSQCAGR